MAIHGSQGILKMIRQPKPSNPYAVPRFRVTLVRDNRAVQPSSPLATSFAAAAVLRPLFAGLDREQFLVCGLDAKQPHHRRQCRLHRVPDLGHRASPRSV